MRLMPSQSLSTISHFTQWVFHAATLVVGWDDTGQYVQILVSVSCGQITLKAGLAKLMDGFG